MKKNIFKKIVASLATVAMAAGLFTAMPAEEAKAAVDWNDGTVYIHGEKISGSWDEKDAKLLSLRFGLEGGLPLTAQQVGQRLGMTADEVEEYINQIAFSGATDFIEKYKDKTNEDQIIGHFGLGFYSAFMVADEVHIDTLSYKPGATPVHWECDGGTEYSMTDGNKAEVGTTITLFLNEESVEFANEYRAKEIITK